jgi:hypothetical protein
MPQQNQEVSIEFEIDCVALKYGTVLEYCSIYKTIHLIMF